ncbi:MAG: amylo-alpha-1,6-glucosidase [Vicinamibacteraceae bacterium]
MRSVRERGGACVDSLDERECQIKERILTQPEASRLAQSANAVVLTYGEVFMLSTESGDVPWGLPHALGLFYHDCRFLNGYLLTLNGRSLTPLASDDLRGYRTRHDLSNPELVDQHGTVVAQKNTIGITRERVVRGSGFQERISLLNFDERSVSVTLELRFRSAFDDIVVLRGFADGPHGSILPSVLSQRDFASLRYRGTDERFRTLSVDLYPPAHRLQGDTAAFDLVLHPDQPVRLAVEMVPAIQEQMEPVTPFRARAHERRSTDHWLDRREDIWRERSARVESSHPLFDRVLDRAAVDLGLLRSKFEGLHYFAAGIPWFVTLFGRDAALTALMLLAVEWRTAGETLRLLARHQAERADEFRDAERGKILHEVRRGELAHVDEIPQSPTYFGSVDSTPLFLILLAEYVRWSGDLDLAHELRPNIDRALRWIDESGHHDRDGYLDYVGQYERALINQGWKDSGNAIVNRDASLAEPPIALCEVQGYLYRAWRQTSAVLRALGDDLTAARLTTKAASLREAFERDFWSEELGCYVMARQRGGRPVSVVSSNAGQLLWSGLAAPDRAARVGRRLMEADMFSGWGVRTLATSERAYNPMGYHRGTVWPHDNALILSGLLRYGLDEQAETIFDALFDAASRFHGYRMPELYCGHPRGEEDRRPLQYPVACNPQAWAAAAIPYALSRLLGLRPDAHGERLSLVRPRLPGWLDQLTLTGVRVGKSVVDLDLSRGRQGDVDVRPRVREGQVSVEVTTELPSPHQW